MHQSQEYLAIQEIVFYLIHIVLEFVNTKLYSTFDLPRNIFNKLTWTKKIPNCSTALTAFFNSSSFTTLAKVI